MTARIARVGGPHLQLAALGVGLWGLALVWIGWAG